MAAESSAGEWGDGSAPPGTRRRPQVFVDPTGRRRQVVLGLIWLVQLVAVLYVLLTVTALFPSTHEGVRG